MTFTIFFATLLRPPNFTTRVLGAVKPSLSEDDDDAEEENDDESDKFLEARDRRYFHENFAKQL